MCFLFLSVAFPLGAKMSLAEKQLADVSISTLSTSKSYLTYSHDTEDLGFIINVGGV